MSRLLRLIASAALTLALSSAGFALPYVKLIEIDGAPIVEPLRELQVPNGSLVVLSPGVARLDTGGGGGGGAGAGLPTDPVACAVNQAVIDIDALGVLACGPVLIPSVLDSQLELETQIGAAMVSLAEVDSQLEFEAIVGELMVSRSEIDTLAELQGIVGQPLKQLQNDPVPCAPGSWVSDINPDGLLTCDPNPVETIEINSLVKFEAIAGAPILSIQEQDGAPALSPVRSLHVSDGSLSLLGGGAALITTGGGGGGGLPSDPSACPAGQYVTDQNVNGVLTCDANPIITTEIDSLAKIEAIAGANILRVREADNAPTVSPVREIRVSDATLTDLGAGVVSITTGAGGGGSGLPADPAACPAGQFVIDQNQSGVLTCSADPIIVADIDTADELAAAVGFRVQAGDRIITDTTGDLTPKLDAALDSCGLGGFLTVNAGCSIVLGPGEFRLLTPFRTETTGTTVGWQGLTIRGQGYGPASYNTANSFGRTSIKWCPTTGGTTDAMFKIRGSYFTLENLSMMPFCDMAGGAPTAAETADTMIELVAGQATNINHFSTLRNLALGNGGLPAIGTTETIAIWVHGETNNDQIDFLVMDHLSITARVCLRHESSQAVRNKADSVECIIGYDATGTGFDIISGGIDIFNSYFANWHETALAVAGIRLRDAVGTGSTGTIRIANNHFEMTNYLTADGASNQPPAIKCDGNGGIGIASIFTKQIESNNFVNAQPTALQAPGVQTHPSTAIDCTSDGPIQVSNNNFSYGGDIADIRQVTNKIRRNFTASGTTDLNEWGNLAGNDYPSVTWDVSGPVARRSTVPLPTAGDQLAVASAAGVWVLRPLPDCDNATSSKLLYDQATDTWSCGTDQGAGGGAPTDAEYLVSEAHASLSAEVAPSAADQVPVTTASAAAAWTAIPDSDGATQKLQYDVAAHVFSAGTDDDVPENGDFGALSATPPITVSGGTIETSIATGRLVGRTTAGAGIMEEITPNATLSLAAGALGVVDVTCSGCLGATEIAALDAGDTTTGAFADARVDGSLEADELGSYVASVADGTGIDGTAAANGATYTPTLDLTEISSATLGAGTFTTLTLDTGATDPVIRGGAGTIEIEAGGTSPALVVDDQGELRLVEEDAGGSNYIAFRAPAALTTNTTCTLENDGNPIPDTCVGDGTDATGSGDAPGGNDNELQYRINATTLGGIANVETDGTHAYLVPVTSHPAATAGGVKEYAYRIASGDPIAVPNLLPSAPAIPIPVLPIMVGAFDMWRCGTANGFLTNGLASVGVVGLTEGTVSGPAWASTSLLTRTPKVTYATAASANSSASYRDTGDHLWIGDGVGKGGFVWFAKWAIATGAANSRLQVGVADSGAPRAASANPSDTSNSSDSVYFGCDAGQSNINVCANDNTTAAACTDLGVNFPCTTSGAFYETWIWAEPNAGTTLSYSINRLDSAQSASGTFPTTNGTPRNSVSLSGHIWLNTGSGTAALALNVTQLCHASGW